MSAPAAASPGSKVVARPRGLAAVAFVALDAVAAIAYLVSGAVGLLILALAPEPGAAGYVVVVKGALVCGWLAIGGWLAWDVLHVRWRFVAAPLVAWAWLYAGMLLLQGRASLAIGY